MKLRHALLSAGMITCSLMCQSDAPSKPGEENHPPCFGANQDRTAFVNEPHSFAVSAADPDSDSLVFDCVSMPANATFNRNTRVFSWVPSVIDSGFTEIIISASDGRFTVFDTIGMMVKPVGNRPPHFGANLDRTAFVNELHSFAVSAADPDSDPLVFDCVSMPANATFNRNTRAFSWVPAATDTGLTEIIISASDGQLTAFDTIGIVVKPVGNHLPQIEPHQKHWIAYVDEELSVEISATNPPADSVTIGVLSRPVGSQSIEAFYTGTVTYMYTPGINDIGAPFAVIFSAWNSSGFVYDTITFEVRQK